MVEDLLGLNEVLRSLRPGYLTKEVWRTIVRGCRGFVLHGSNNSAASVPITQKKKI